MYSIMSLLQDYDASVSRVVASGPVCGKCGIKVDLPDGLDCSKFCSVDCLPAPSIAPLDANGLPLPSWRVGYEPGRR
jgi:hypothetical protein